MEKDMEVEILTLRDSLRSRNTSTWRDTGTQREPERDLARYQERSFKRCRQTLYETERHTEPEISQTDRIIQRHVLRDLEAKRQTT